MDDWNLQYTNIEHPVWGHVRVHVFNRPISDESTKYLSSKTEYSPTAVVRLVNIFNFLAYYWTIKDAIRSIYYYIA